MSLFQSTGNIIAKNPPAVKAFAGDLEYFSYVFLVSRSLNSSLLFSLRLLRFSARISSLSGSISRERCRRSLKSRLLRVCPALSCRPFPRPFFSFGSLSSSLDVCSAQKRKEHAQIIPAACGMRIRSCADPPASRRNCMIIAVHWRRHCLRYYEFSGLRATTNQVVPWVSLSSSRRSLNCSTSKPL